jgi:hypothetical protein
MWEANSDGLLFFVEGTGQNMWGLSWGNGFITDTDIINGAGISDANPFFQQLATKPYVDRVVITPHCYPPSINGGAPWLAGPLPRPCRLLPAATAEASSWAPRTHPSLHTPRSPASRAPRPAGGNMVGQELFYKLSKSFGYLNKHGYCHNGACRTYPIVIGEFGSSMVPDIDRQWLGDFAKYIFNRDDAADGNHEHIGGWMWWAYNANSGDTGGIVTDDWQGFNWQKINYLQTVGLVPWYDRH